MIADQIPTATRPADQPPAEAAGRNSLPMAVVPIGLRIEGRPILVVGAGPIAARKAAAYIDRGAAVTVVAPEHGPAMNRLAVAARRFRNFTPTDLDGMWLVVTATGTPAVDHQVFKAAEARQIWCNSADDPANCSAILPAVARRDSITVAVHTGGASPAVASWLRRRVEELLDRDTLAVAEIAARVRASVRRAGLRTEVPGWADVLDGEALDLVAEGRPEQLERRLFEAVVGDRLDPPSPSAEPGAPDRGTANHGARA